MTALEHHPTIELTTPEHRRKADLERYAPLVVWLIVGATLIFVCLRIIGSGFIPGGDARRHVAKAFTERPYTDLVVMRPEYTMDHSPGWEWLLRMLHGAAGWDSDALMSFSIFATMGFVLFAALPWVKRPEAWLAALLAQLIAIPELMTRLTQARPYLVTEGILIAVLFAWSKAKSEDPSRLKLAMTCLGFALSVWMHGAWYLWVLPLVAFFLAGWWRAGLWLSACCGAGTIGGALLTGKPIEFLRQAVLIAAAVSKEHIPQWLLVGEFRPSYGEFSTLVLIAIVWLWRRQQTRSSQDLLSSPVFCLALICWILGFKADRFWADWGIPAVLVWLAVQFQGIMMENWAVTSWRRVLAAGCIGLPLLLHATNDLDRRYSASMNDIFLDARQPALQSWMPEPHGIFYTANMDFFYNTFYKNPQGDWRYVLGMEPALMTDADLNVFRGIQLSNYSIPAFETWVERMTPADRLELACSAQPNLPRLEWTNVVANIWIGRLPRR